MPSDAPGASRPRPGDKGSAHDWLLVDTADPEFTDRVIGDITDILRTAIGRALLRRIFVTNRAVHVIPVAHLDPPNAWVRPFAPASEAAGAGRNSLLAYEPADWPSPAHPGSPPSDAVLFSLLREACRIAEGTAAAQDQPPAVPLYDGDDIARYREERGHV